MAAELDIGRVALFECYETKKDNKKFNVTDLVGKKIFDLKEDIKKYDLLKSTLEFNIKKKLMSKETKDLSKKKCVESSVHNIFDISPQGRTPISLVLNLKKEGKSLFDKLLESSDEKSFRTLSAEFAGKYVNYKKTVKGIIGFIQFKLKTNSKEENFLSIITTDFIKGALSSDPSTALKFLEKAFDQNFKNIIIYPRLESISRKTININKNLVKIHQRKSDPDLFTISNIESPLNPQKIFEDLYKSLRGQTSNLKEILDQLDDDFHDKVDIILRFKDYPVKIKIKDFIENFTLINENSKGQGIFIKKAFVNVEIAGKNLLNDGKVRYISLNDLSEELNKENESKDKTQTN